MADSAEGPGNGLRTWVFNPFHYVAGGPALAIGLVLILATGAIGAASNSHFDGVLDFHTGAKAPFWFFLTEGLINWISLSVVLLVAGVLVSKSRIRPLDVLGTQALARAPMLVTALAALLPGYGRFTEAMLGAAQGMASGERPFNPWTFVNPPGAGPGDLATAAAVCVIALVMLIYMVLLMYRAYAVSANTGGGKGVASFIVALLAAEVISKVLVGVAMLAPAAVSAPVEDFDPVFRGREFVAQLAGGQFDAAYGQFDGNMKSAMSQQELEGVWTDLVEKAGPYQEEAGARIEKTWMLTSVFVTCKFEKRSYDIQVVFNRAGQVCGLWLR